jgi:sugar lactone lactonase YvrE
LVVLRVALLLLALQLSYSQPQPDYVVDGGGILNQPWGMCTDPITGDLWVVEYGNNRTLRFTSSSGYATPVAVLGQPNFTSYDGPNPPTAASLRKPQDVLVDQFGTLWVVDSDNKRVLWYFNAATKPNGSNADGVLGQPGFNTADFDYPSGNQFHNPSGLHVDSAGTLWVADFLNNRVLRFVDAVNKTNGASADSVLGQATFNTSNNSCSPSGMDHPSVLRTTASGNLIVTDQLHNRVLVFTSNNAVLNGSEPSVVFMQQDLNSCSDQSPTASTGKNPNGLAIDSVGNLYVSEHSTNRVLMYPGGAFATNATSDGMSASFVYGQPDFNSSQPGSSTNQLHSPVRLYFDNTRNVLWVADTGNNRILGFKTYTSDSSGLTLQVSFQGTSPSVVLLPKDLQGIRPLTYKTLFQPLQMEERDGQNQLVESMSFPLSGYTAATSTNDAGAQFFNFSISLNETTVDFEYGLFANTTQIESGGVQFNILPSTLKLTLKVNGWNCAATTNSLFVSFSLTTTPPLSNFMIVEDSSSPGLVDLVLNSTGAMRTTVRLLKYAVVDGANTAVNFSFDSNTNQLKLQFPCFQSSLTYDPDFSVIIGDGGTGGGGGGIGGSGNLQLLALISLIIPVLLLLVVGVVVGVIWLVRRRARAKTRELINYTPDNDDHL